MSAIATGIISLSILIFGIFLIIFFNLADIIERFGRRVAIDVYLVQGIEKEAVSAIREKIELMNEVSEIQFISADDAYETFKVMLGPQGGLLDELGENPLPASFRLSLKKEYRNSDALAAIAQRLKKVQGVDEVRYGAEWVSRFDAVIQTLRLLGLVIGAILLLADVLIVSNTIRLTIFSRSEEIEIMRLIGATETMIRAPFFLEGMLQGFLSGLVAIGLLWLVYKTLFINIHFSLGAIGSTQFLFLPASIIAPLVAVSTLLGVIGSTVAFSRFTE